MYFYTLDQKGKFKKRSNVFKVLDELKEVYIADYQIFKSCQVYFLIFFRKIFKKERKNKKKRPHPKAKTLKNLYFNFILGQVHLKYKSS